LSFTSALHRSIIGEGECGEDYRHLGGMIGDASMVGGAFLYTLAFAKDSSIPFRSIKKNDIILQNV